MRITIGGCRDFNDYEIFKKFVAENIEKCGADGITILSGHCSGVDAMAERYAEENGYALEIHPADWKKYGRAAGPKRIKDMVAVCDEIIEFWDGKSKGTKNLIQTAKKLQKSVLIKYI